MRYLFEDYALDTDQRELRRGNAPVAVAPKVFDLLAYVIENRERVVSRDDLIAHVWGGRIVSEAALARCINGARSAIGDSGETQRLIKTFQRKGLRFVGTLREEQAPPGNAANAATGTEKPAPTLALPDRPSIAVLPLDNLSGDKGQDYFSDGISEDILTELSRFSELFIIARNSSFQYKGKAVDVRQVGRELGVRYVLQGSIRGIGDRVRISVQLADAVTGAQRWAERYERQLDDVFAVQDEVACTIVAILAAHVNKAEIERTRQQGTGDLAGVRLLPPSGRCPRLILVIMGGGRALRGASPLGAFPRDRPQLRARLRQACPDPSYSLARLAGW